jgi:hypothetical protein
MISAQTRSAFVARENRFPLFRIMLKTPILPAHGWLFEGTWLQCPRARPLLPEIILDPGEQLEGPALLRMAPNLGQIIAMYFFVFVVHGVAPQ